MPNIRRTFIGGKMNLDVDNRLLPEGEYREATNFDVLDSQGEGGGKAENSLGNRQLTNFSFGPNAKCIGKLVEPGLSKIFWWVKSDTLSAIMEWDDDNQLLSTVLLDSRSNADNVLNLSFDYLITGANIIIDSNNNKTFLFWVDNNGPRGVNLDTAKSLQQSAFEAKDIMVIKAPPVNRPEITLLSNFGNENYIKEELLFFAYRYIYADDQYSALSPFSEIAFEPEQFSFDYSTSTNNAMVNRYNSLEVRFNTGDRLVKGIDIIFKKSNSNVLYVAESIDKGKKGLSDNVTSVYSFNNNKTYKVITESQLKRLYDQVPILANAQEVIANRIVYGDYTIGYDLVDVNGSNVLMDYRVELVSNVISGDFAKSLKSIRDYEVGIVYKDGFSRATTVLVSEGNTVRVKAGLCKMQNKLRVNIKNLAPSFATHYNFYIKQSQYDYDVLSPAIFHQDGVFLWIKMEGGDIDKIKQGDFIYVKSDTSGILDKAVQTEVLEIQYQEKNFLEPDTETEEKQRAGTYFKIKPTNFNINQNAAAFFNFESKGFESRSADNDNRNSLTNNVAYIESAIFKGGGLDDVLSGGVFTGALDKRITVEIFAEGTPDTFRWSDDEGASWNDNSGSGFAITGGAQTIVDGIQVTFSATTGHTLGDSWVIAARADEPITEVNDSRHAWVLYKGKTIGNESIKGGAQIIIDYHERRDDATIVNYRKTFVTSQLYDNIEEWFYGDNIISQLEHPATLDNVFFRRGTATNFTDGIPESMDIGANEDMYMLFKSKVTYSGSQRISVEAKIEIIELDNPVILETKPPNINSDEYFEFGKTYLIQNGYHLGGAGDTNQSNGVDAVITLDFYNCFAFGNGFESYKIKDKFNANSFKIDTKPSTTIERYGKERKKSGIIWSGVFQQTTNYNALNEFNASTINFTELDDQYGSIKKLFRRGDRLFAFQEDKITPIGSGIREITDAQGNSAIVKSDAVFSALEPFAGEYGISDNPESFAFFGNRIYFLDSKRGVVCRFSIDGITEISRYGLNNFFRNEFAINKKPLAIGGYDPYHDKYILSVDDRFGAQLPVLFCGNELTKYNITESFQYIVRFDGNQTSVDIVLQVLSGQVDISANFNGNIDLQNNVVGTTTLTVNRTDLSITDVTVTITPDVESGIKVSHSCSSDNLNFIKLLVINDVNDYALNNGVNNMSNRFKVNGNTVSDKNVVFRQSGPALFETKIALNSDAVAAENGDTIEISAYSALVADHLFSTERGNRMGYLVSTTDYGDGDVAAILAGATFLTVGQVDGASDRTSSGSFVLAKPTPQHIVYLIIDYTDTLVVANDDSIGVYNGQYVDINVLANDLYSGIPIITITSPPSNGTVSIIGNIVRYYHDGSGVGVDSFEYQIDNGIDTDTATVNITVTTNPLTPIEGGGGGVQANAFSISATGYDSGFSNDGQPACEYVLSSTKYHDGSEVNPTLDDKIYNDANKTTVFNGLNRYYAISNGRTIRINTNGVVTDVWICTAGGGGSA